MPAYRHPALTSLRLYIPVERPKHGTAIYLACIVPFVILAAHQWSYLPRLTDGDFAQYILHAKALVEGRGYTDTGYIFTPFSYLVGPRAQPPGLPLLLSPLVALFGPDLMVLKSVVVLSAVCFAMIAARYFGRRENVWTGAAVALLTTLALQTQHATISVIADLPFAAACWWLISLADREGAWTGYRAAVVTALGGVVVAFRVAGAAAGVAVLIFALLCPPAQKRAASLPLVLWALGGLAALGLVGEFIPFAKQVMQLPQANILERMLDFAQHAKEAVLFALLYPFRGDKPNDVYHALFLIPMTLGGVRFLVRYRRTFAWSFTLAYMMMLALSPVQEARYIWPLYPVLAYALVDGMSTMLRTITSVPGLVPRAPAVAFGTLAVLAMLATFRAFGKPAPRSLLGDPDAQSLFSWLKTESERSPERVVFINPRVLTFATGIPAMAPIYARNPRILAEFEKRRITSVVLGDLGMGEVADSILRTLITESPDRFTPVYANPSFEVIRFAAAADRATIR